jgi:transposase
VSKAKPFSAESLARIKELLRNSRTKGQFKRVQCLWLRGALGLESDQVAIALDWHPSAVRRLWARYLHEGEKALAGPGRGGRRNASLTKEEERALLARLAQAVYPNSVIPARQVQEAVERQVGHPVDASAIYRMMARQSWRRTAAGLALIPGWAPTGINPWEESTKCAGPAAPDAAVSELHGQEASRVAGGESGTQPIPAEPSTAGS